MLKKAAKFLSLFVAASMALTPTGQYIAKADDYSSYSGAPLQFKNGKFKILILSDIQDTDTPQKETTDLINAAIDATQPDFIALTGDNIAGQVNTTLHEDMHFLDLLYRKYPKKAGDWFSTSNKELVEFDDLIF